MASSETVDTTPIPVKTPGILGLDVTIYPQATGEVQVRGHLSFAVSRTVDQAISFLPPLVRWGLSNSLIHRELKGNTFRFKVANLTSVDTELNQAGTLAMSVKYHNPLARPIGHAETSKIFRRFADEIAENGLTPRSHGVIDEFLSTLGRRDRGDLPFLQLFEGRSIVRENSVTPPIVGLTLDSFTMKQDSAGDLIVEFVALGRIQQDQDSAGEADDSARLAG